MKFKNNIHVAVSLIFLGLAAQVSAQIASKSPYTKLGYGDMVFRGFAEQLAQGGITSTFNSDRGYSIENPASLASVRFSLFSFGVWSYGATLENQLTEQQQGDFGYGYFGLAVPLMANTKKKNVGCGLAFGLTPFTATGYESVKLLSTANGDIPFFNFSEGDGGMSRVYMSTGFNVTKALSFGAGISYIFGTTEARQTIFFPDTLELLRSQQLFSSFQNGFVYDLGFQWRSYLKRDTVKITSNLVQTIGVSSALSTKVNTETDYLARVDGISRRLEDTILFAEGALGSYNLPRTMRFGYSLEKLRKWQMSAEWQYNTYNGEPPTGMNDFSTLRFGLNYCPDFSATRKFFKTNVYRLGYYSGNTPFLLGGQQVPEWAITAGITIPVTVPYTGNQVKSGIHFSMEYHERGAVNDILIKEKYWRFTLGFTLADRWFIKPRIE